MLHAFEQESVGMLYFSGLYQGARETDYPAGEEVTQNAEVPPAGNGSSHSSNSISAGGDGVLGGITVVGCEAEGMTAVAQIAGGTDDVDTGQQHLMFAFVSPLTGLLSKTSDKQGSKRYQSSQPVALTTLKQYN